jgi:hypothetical protein
MGKTDFLVGDRLVAYENGEEMCTRSWTTSVPWDPV